MNRTEKAELAASLKEKFGKAQVALFADYKGLGSNQANELRRLMRGQQVEVKVLKNNVARLVSNEGALGEEGKVLMEQVVGPTLVAFSYGDPAAAAKVFHKFAKDNEALKIKDGLMGAKRLSASDVEALASLPSREVMLARFLGTLNAPISNFVGVLAAVPRSLVNVLSAIEKKKSET